MGRKNRYYLQPTKLSHSVTAFNPCSDLGGNY